MSDLAPSSLRPTPARRDTEAILSYYQSDLAGTQYIPPHSSSGPYHDSPGSPSRPALLERSSSTTSSSSTYSSPSTPSCYDSSFEGPPPAPGSDPCAPSTHRRRPSNISHPDTDTRRMAIVHVDTPPFFPLSADKNLGIQRPDNVSADTLPSRRAFDRHLPHLPLSGTPSPPALPSFTMLDTSQGGDANHSSAHHRSTSEATYSTSSDASRHRTSLKEISTSTQHRSHDNPRRDPLKESNSSLPSTTPIMSTHHHPDDLSSDRVSTSEPHDSTQLSSYLHYQPGVHSTAGPLPPPPRAMFQIDVNMPPPPRPPRLRSPSPIVRSGHDESDTPVSLSAVLPKKLSRSSLQRPNSAQSADGSLPPVAESPRGHTLHHSESSSRHVREGAFAPSSITVTPPHQFQPPPPGAVRLVGSDLQGPPDVLDAKPSLTPATATTDILDVPPPRPELRRDPSWVSVKVPSDSPEPVLEEERSSSPISVSLSPPPSSSSHAGSSSAPRSKKEGTQATRSPTSHAKGVLTDMKRYSSLPRTPSFASDSTRYSKLPSRRPPPPKRKVLSQWPDAMWCKDVVGERSALDRAMGYAQKINELAMYDCGLSDWVLSVKDRGTSRTSTTRSLPSSPAHANARPISVQPRQTSRSSISSEATFPLRPDAYTATDLSPRPTDIMPDSHVPPALPYPALATPTATPNRLSTLGTPPLTTRTLPIASNKSPGGFFSSLGRNYSLKKEDKRGGAPRGRVLTKPPPSQPASNPRPVHLFNAPSVPGGPRAAPSRISRSQTLMVSPSPPTSESVSPVQAQPRRRSNTLKRPSLFGRSPPTASPSPSEQDALPSDFNQQVDKLADLLPHVERDVLAGYLRRAGQDILAIGQYLEDEKNGTIRHA